MLLAQGISLNRSNKVIFGDTNLSLNPGKVIVLKGKNGSGKTTFIKTLLNILEPTKGNIYWKGKIVKKNLYDFYNNTTYIADKTSSIRQLSVNENIELWKHFSLSKIKVSQINSILDMLNLNNYKNKKVSSLSMGEIKKLELLRLILENKKIWILDEPLANLDNESIGVLIQTFNDHCENNGSIIFSSHQKIEFINNEEILF